MNSTVSTDDNLTNYLFVHILNPDDTVAVAEYVPMDASNGTDAC